MTEKVLAKRAGELLAAIRATEGWISRAKLADATGKRILSPNDRNHLITLERAGEIESMKQPAANPQGYEWVYRVKQG